MKVLRLCPFCGQKPVICKPIEGLTGYVIRCSTNSCIEMIGGHLGALCDRWNNRMSDKRKANAEKFLTNNLTYVSVDEYGN